MNITLRRARLLELGALAAFAAATAAALPALGWLTSSLAGFSFASLLYTIAVALMLERASPEALPIIAARHDQRAAFVLGAGLALDFAALGLIILFVVTRTMNAVAIGFAGLAILSAWLLLNMLFAIHYAHLHYSIRNNGEAVLVFLGGEPKRFSDFVYFAFVVGMTFHVSDVAIASGSLRRLVLAQSILAFLFNVFVIALAVNAFGNLI